MNQNYGQALHTGTTEVVEPIRLPRSLCALVPTVMPYTTQQTIAQALRAPYVPDPEERYLDDATGDADPTHWQVAFEETSSSYTSDTEINVVGLYTADGAPIPAGALFQHERHYPDWRQRMRGACRHALQAGIATQPSAAPVLDRAALAKHT